jgi:predicted rRNA pseudouridine synthase
MILFMEKLLNFGLINIDKPAGPTSYSVSEFVKKLLGLGKTSHMGTLDPKVSGVLPVTLGRACKLADYFIRHDKTYVGILETHKECDIEELQDLIDDNFVGKIRQTPPKRSAVKIAERVREVYSWTLTDASDDGRSFLFECRVEGGTYIRKLCSDLGDMIGGAHMGDLRRTEAGIFSEKEIYTLDELEAAVEKWKAGDDSVLKGMIVPAEVAIKKVLPVVQVEKRAVKSLYVGKPLFVSDVVGETNFDGDFFALFCGKKFIGVYKRNDVRPRSLSPTEGRKIFGRSEFVFTNI